MPHGSTTVFLDLDGPILECRARHYACYLELCRRFGVTPRGPERYWGLRRQRVGAVDLLRAGGARAEEDVIRQAWIESIEQPRFLSLDYVYPLVLETLATWRSRGLRVLVVTLRRDEAAARVQLQNLRVLDSLDGLVVCDPALGGSGKAAAAEAWASDFEPGRWIWIGDTEVDATAGTALGAELYLVSGGIRSARYLRSLGVGRVVRDVPALLDRVGRSPCVARIPGPL